MEKRKKIGLAVAGAILALAAIGGGVGLASGGDDDRPLPDNVLEDASRAALEHVGGGTVVESEMGDGGAAYEVEVRRDDGSVVEIGLDSDFNVIGTERDDEGSDEEETGEDD